MVYPPHRSFYEVLAERTVVAGRRGMTTAHTSDALMRCCSDARERRAVAAVLPSRRGMFRSGQVARDTCQRVSLLG